MNRNLDIKTRERFFRYGNDEDRIDHVIAHLCEHQWSIQKFLKSNKYEKAISHVESVIYYCNTLDTIRGNPEDPEAGLREITAQIKEILDYMEEDDGVTTLPEQVYYLHMYLRVICDDLDKYHSGKLK